MIVEKKYDPARGTYYAVCADIRETGRNEPTPIITFDQLTTAALVIKYLRGDRMTWGDIDAAKAAIKAAGADPESISIDEV